jgi:predicted ATPase/DNA-binding SARP family transcriptional activator
MSGLQLTCLPAVAAVRDGRPVEVLRGANERALLVYLAVEGDRAHPRGVLAGLLWPEAPEATARRNLSQALLTLRAALGEAAAPSPALLVTRETLAWNPAAPASVDVGTIVAHLDAAEAHGHAGPAGVAGCPACLGRLRAAAEAYRGPFLGEFAGPPSELFEEWAALTREWLRRRVAGALETLAEAALQNGEPGAAAGYARRELALEPLAEGAHRRLMRALSAGGDRGAALAQYAACRRLLAAELGAEPAPETAALAERLRAGAAGLPPAAGDAGAPRAPAPRRRARPRRGGPGGRQVGGGAPSRSPARAAPLALVPPAAVPRAAGHNLPAPLTALVGRERELAAVARRLGETRLLTLTGPGGGGKTRLALAVAARLAAAGGPRGNGASPVGPPSEGPAGAEDDAPAGPPYPDGVWLAELAALADPELVPQAVAAALGVPEAPGRALTDTLGRALRHRRLLLVVDNCEHLLGACATLAQSVLRAGPGVRVLATSREPLGLPGEATWWVPPLAWPAGPAGETLPPAALPPPEALLGYGAVRLFVERARDVWPAFALTPANAPAVVQVCARLDGLPLALELAARRAAVLPPAELAARLDARFRLLTGGNPAAHPRQRTLAATLDWSHALLGEAERVLFRRLSVFAGGFDLEAAEAVCADGPAGSTPAAGPVPPAAPGGAGGGAGRLPAAGVLEALRRLVDQSLVVAEADPGAGTGAGAARYRLLETVRQYATERLREAGEAEAVHAHHAAWAVGLAAAAAPGLLGRDQLEWLARLDAEQDNLRAALGWCLRRDPGAGLRLAGRLWPYWRIRQHYAEGTDWLAHALARVPAPGRAAAWARAALGAGILARDRGDTAAARGYLEASLARSRALGETGLVAWALRDLGLLRLQLGELGAAEGLLAEGLALARAAGDERGAAAALTIRATVAARCGDFGRARALHEESLAAARRAGDRWLLWTVLHQLGTTAVDQGDLDAAGPVLEEGLALARDLGLPTRAAHFEFLLGRVALARGQPERALPLLEALRAAAAEAEGPDTAWGLPAALADLGRAAHARGQPAEAAAVLGQALRLRQGLGEPLGVVECLEALAAVAAGPAPDRAARLLGAAAATRRALGAPPKPIYRPEIAAAEGAARAALGAPAYAAARAAGEALSLEQAAAEALREAPPAAS